MKRFFFTLVQLTWGLPQSLVGFILYLYWRSRKAACFVWHGAVVTQWTVSGGVSLGLFVFVPDKAGRYITDGRELTAEESRRGVLVHEYGHCIQSLLLGPAYLLLVGLPSFTWANLPALRRLRRERGLSYYSVYPENWANRLGERATGSKSVGLAMPAGRAA